MTADDVDGPTLEEIELEECLALVAASSVGRLAVSVPGGPPLVVPVNYVLEGEVVVFRTDEGTKLSALRGHPVSFQVDWVDDNHRTGWSVLIQGTAVEATEDEVGHLRVEPWPGGERHHWIRVVPDKVTGRRIRLPEIIRDSRGYL